MKLYRYICIHLCLLIYMNKSRNIYVVISFKIHHSIYTYKYILISICVHKYLYIHKYNYRYNCLYVVLLGVWWWGYFVPPGRTHDTTTSRCSGRLYIYLYHIHTTLKYLYKYVYLCYCYYFNTTLILP